MNIEFIKKGFAPNSGLNDVDGTSLPFARFIYRYIRPRNDYKVS